MLDATITITSAAGTRTLALAAYSDPADEERAHREAYAWIKGLRQLDVDGAPFRDRFTVRGDSLWWFSEIYLHKTRAILETFRSISALRRLMQRERPSAVRIDNASVVVQHMAAQVLPGQGGLQPVDPAVWATRLRSIDSRARRLNLLARMAPDRFRRTPRARHATVAAFIHRAFWRTGGDDGAAETYIGPVLRDLEARLGTDSIQYVGVGPATHFRAHRPWRPSASSSTVVPVERYATRGGLAASREVWRKRQTHLASLEQGTALREWAVISGVDCWPIVREQLAGIVWLQWPWSVRSMDDAAAALDALQPRSALTYAEAGGWGRAMILEARRRGIPTAGLQHGFIYRHWLNYLHEPDEISADDRTAFPRPTRTLLFDQYAATHLISHGRFPPSSLAVTGSPRLDALADSVRRLSPDDLGAVRRRLDIRGDVLLVATKEREARSHLASLIEAAAALPNLTVVIKPHPAENAEAYEDVVRGGTAVRVVQADEPLAPLLAIATAVATINSTVALDAGVLGVPALSFGLPNNLTPFVEAGALAGATDPAELAAQLRRILYDEGFRRQLAEGRELMLGRGTLADGRAAERAAAAIEQLASPPR